MAAAILYHGSSFLHADLKPGFIHTGELLEWDGALENNKFLYASSVKSDAFDQAIASWLERRFEILRFKSEGKKYEVFLKDEKVPTQQELDELKVYVYRISFYSEDGWVKNNNPHNNLSTEYKTQQVIPTSHILSVQKFDVRSVADRLQFISPSDAGLEEYHDYELSFRQIPEHIKPIYMKWW